MTDPLRRITDLTIGDFAQAYWGVAPLHRTAAQLSESDFSDLLSRDAVDELLSRRGLRTPFVRMTRDGDVISPARYTRSGGAGAEISDQVADDRVLAEFAAGATLVLQGMHRMWPPIQAFARELSAQLGHPVQVNAYVTPPQNQGLASHYDVHDVFVLQFAGRKHWRIHAPVWELPLRDQPWNDRKAAVEARAEEEPLIDTVLECGDTLYLPRGYVHSAASLGDFSGHLTVGVHAVTRRTLADHVLSALSDDLELRRSLPVGRDLSDASVIDDEVTATLAALRAALDRVDRVAVARGIGRHLAATTRAEALRPLAQLALADAVTPETRVTLRPGLRVQLRIDGDDVVVAMPDSDARFPAAAAAAARTATSGAIVSAVTLMPAKVDEGVTLVAQLLRAGIVVPA